MRRELKLEELMHVDGGRIAVAFNQALARLAADCEDRPGDNKPRVVTLQCALVPMVDARGQYEDAKAQFQISDSIPKRKSKVIDLQPTRKSKGGRQEHSFAFNDLSEDDANQRTIDEMTGE
jgi:hypothetical protein